MRPVPVLLAFLLAGAGMGVLAAGAQSPDDGGDDEDPVAVTTDEPLDPEGPWVVSATSVHVRPGLGLELSLTTPLTARSDQGPVDRVVVRSQEGAPLVGLGCASGTCELRTPLDVREIPAASVALEGPWHQGRLTGVSLTTLGGAATVGVDAFGPQGIRVDGEGLTAPVTVTTVLVVEGDPRDPDRLALRGPDGSPVLVAEPRGDAPARLTVGGERVAVDRLHVELVGDPLSDDSVTVRLWLDGDRLGFRVLQTPAGAYQAAGAALEEHLLLRSPTRDANASYLLAAGPVLLDGPGTVSPRFDASVRVAVPNASAYDRGWVLLAGEPIAALSLSGQDGDERVLHAAIPAGRLPAHGTYELSARLERDLAPGLVQVQHAEAIRLEIDATGPDPPRPSPTADEASFAWTPSPGVASWEAQARPAGGDWQPAPVNGTHAHLPDGPDGPWEGRVRGVDDAGNPGPWSDPVELAREEPTDTPRGPPSLTLRVPEDGATLSGPARIAWAPDPSIEWVQVTLRHDGVGPSREIAEGRSSPLTWETRSVPDGTHTLRVTAIGTDERTTRVVEVHVDNLDEAEVSPHPLGHARSERTGSQAPASPMPGRPLPTAIAAAGVLFGASFLLVRASRGTRDSDGKR